MADSISDAEKIRMKRLAKLDSQSNSNSGPSSSSTPAVATTESSDSKGPEEQPSVPEAPTTRATTSEPEQNPFSQLGVKPENKPPQRIHITPKAPSSPAAEKAIPSKPTHPQDSPVSLETWEHRTLSTIFRLSLDAVDTKDGHGHRLTLVQGVVEDLKEGGRPVRLSTEVLDQAILEAASAAQQGKPLDYLLGCWKRVVKMYRGLHNKNDPKHAILKEARRLCFSYCIFAATIPDMFGGDLPMENPLAEYLLADAEGDRGICHDFLAEAVARFNEDESVKDVLVGAMETISHWLSTKTMNDDYKPYISAMRHFVRYPALLVAMTESKNFLPPDVPAQAIENSTLLGPFFALSPMQGPVALHYFAGRSAADRAYVSNSQKSLRMTLQTHQDELFDIANHFVKTKQSREKTLDWFALSVNANHKRRALQVDQSTVSSDGFMVNVTVILDRLCEPFMDATFSKIDRIDVDYLRRSPRVLINDETKINADQHESDEFYGSQATGTNNFITEIFFLTVAAHHYGTEATNTKLSQLQRDVKWLEKQVTQLELERHKFAHAPAQLRVFEAHVKKLKDRVEKGQCTILSIQGVLLDESSQTRSMQLMRYVIVWLLRLVSPGTNFPRGRLQLPLPEKQPEVFKCLPEYFLEDIVDNFKFITRQMPQIITSTQCEELVMICITFLRSSEYIKNPYLKSGLVTILCHGVYPVYTRAKGILGDVLSTSDFAIQHLLHALMKQYIECESTGTHTQFFDKFNIRYEIFQVIKCIWSNPVYRDNLETEGRVNLDFFVRFVNLLLNDVTFVLDESFTAFKKINELTKLLKNPPSDMDATVRQEKEEALSAAQRNAKSYMQLTNETVYMLRLFTEALGDSFTKAEIVQRLADMLDYNLDALVGVKKASLKVENAEEFGWNPKTMLSEISDVYLNLKDKESFIRAVAADGRSYKPENFTAAHGILQRYALKSSEQLEEWSRLTEAIQNAKEEADQDEQDLGEIPDEFLDPIMFSLMEEPVILPRSKATVDLSTIRSHLLSDPHDPFNRTPLTIDQVKPNLELKAKIEAFKAERKTRRHTDTSGGNEPMDTS